MKTRPRIATGEDHDRTQIYNGNFAPSGVRIGDFENPWTVLGPGMFHMAPTHAAAIEYATCGTDPTPETQESVTTGWTPAPDRADSWQEKWDLTR